MSEGQRESSVSRRVAFAGAAAAAVGVAEVVRASGADAAPAQNWSTVGNSITATDFLGGTSVQPLVFKTAATAGSPVERMRIATNGAISMNTAAAGGNLTINTFSGSVGVRLLNTTGNGNGAAIYATSTAAPALSAVNGAGNAIKVVHNGTDGTGAGVLINTATATGLNVANSKSGTAINASTASGTGVSATGSGYGVVGTATASYGYGAYFNGGTLGSYAYGGTYGAYGYGGTYGVYGSSGSYGVYGTNSTSGNYGVYGAGGQYAVAGNGGSTAAVRGDNGYVGGYFVGGSWGAYTECSGTSGGYGFMSKNSNSDGYAIWATGNVNVTGTLSKAAGSFRIDHPLDPKNKWLSHSFVESPDMMNVYNGNVTLDSSGNATVTLPSYFNALNKEFRYQLTCIGGHADVYISSEVAGNSFKIGGGKAGLKVSWQVTGIRQDDYAKAHPIVVEAAKAGAERGTLQFVPKGSSAKAFASAPKAAPVAEHKVEPLKKPPMPAAPKPGIGQDWVPPKL